MRLRHVDPLAVQNLAVLLVLRWLGERPDLDPIVELRLRLRTLVISLELLRLDLDCDVVLTVPALLG